MLGALLCLIAFAAATLATRHSMVRGIVVVLAVGYVYGIVRANVLQPLSHFVFDAAVGGFYVAMLRRRMTPAERRRTAPIRNWMLLLIGWPVVLSLLPVQDPLVQLVGLRGNVFLVPFLIIGARLTVDEMEELVPWVAALNLGAFVFAVLEFQIGIEPFFPRSPVTDILYNSRDIVTSAGSVHRIPATFSSAHAYGGTMAFSTALLIGALQERPRKRAVAILLMAALLVSVIGVFMAGARQPVIFVGAMLAGTLFFARLRPVFIIGGIALLLGLASIVTRTERLQRFRTLENTEYVAARVSTSVNQNFVELAMKYPMGNGLGAGGTSLPYFLADRIQDAVTMENEYARIMLEQGLPGLIIWLVFLVRTLSSGLGSWSGGFRVGRRLLWITCTLAFGTAFIGLGLLASVPGSALLLMSLGFVAAQAQRQPRERRLPIPESYAGGPARVGAAGAGG